LLVIASKAKRSRTATHWIASSLALLAMTARAGCDSDTRQIARLRLPPWPAIVVTSSPAERRWVSHVLNVSDPLKVSRPVAVPHVPGIHPAAKPVRGPHQPLRGLALRGRW